MSSRKFWGIAIVVGLAPLWAALAALADDDAAKKAKDDKPEVASAAKPKDELMELYGVFVDAVEQVESNYYRKLDRRELLESALRGMLQDLDPHSTFISTSEWQQFQRLVCPMRYKAGQGIESLRPTCRRSASSMRSMPMASLASSKHMRSFVVLNVGTTSVGGELLRRALRVSVQSRDLLICCYELISDHAPLVYHITGLVACNADRMLPRTPCSTAWFQARGCRLSRVNAGACKPQGRGFGCAHWALPRSTA